MKQNLKLLFSSGRFTDFLNTKGELIPLGNEEYRYEIPTNSLVMNIEQQVTLGKFIIIHSKRGNVFVFEKVM